MIQLFLLSFCSFFYIFLLCRKESKLKRKVFLFAANKLPLMLCFFPLFCAISLFCSVECCYTGLELMERQSPFNMIKILLCSRLPHLQSAMPSDSRLKFLFRISSSEFKSLTGLSRGWMYVCWSINY